VLSASIHTAILGFCSGDFATPSKLIEVTPFARSVVLIVELTNWIQFKMCFFLHLMMFMLISFLISWSCSLPGVYNTPYLSVKNKVHHIQHGVLIFFPAPPINMKNWTVLRQETNYMLPLELINTASHHCFCVACPVTNFQLHGKMTSHNFFFTKILFLCVEIICSMLKRYENLHRKKEKKPLRMHYEHLIANFWGAFFTRLMIHEDGW
jgi:hypothetical protein